VAREGEKTTSRRRGTYAFGVVSSDTNARAPLERLCNALSPRMNLVMYPQVLRSYAALANQLASGGVDVAWLPPLLAGEAIAAGNADLIACVQRELGGLYHSVLFARKDSGITVLGDLQRRSIAWVDRQSAAGYVVPRRWLELSGFAPDAMFARETFAGTHADAARAVLRGSADAGATFVVLEPRSRKVIDSGWHALPDADDMLVVVGSAGAVPADAIAASMRVAPDIRNELAEAFLTLSDDERELAGKIFRSHSFERCSPVYLDMLRRLTESPVR
jgi:phosphonate transport system substrate-binding protein